MTTNDLPVNNLAVFPIYRWVWL